MSNKKQTWANAHSQLWTAPSPRSASSRTQSEVSSVTTPNKDRSLVEYADVADRTNNASAINGSRSGAYKPREKTLVQVSDLLESYGTIASESDIPAVLLSVVKDLEQAKRENSFKNLLLREYEDAVRRRFSLYGEEAVPSVAEVSRRLREDAAADSAAPPAPLWLEGELNELRCVLQEADHNCFAKNTDFALPMLLPNASQTRTNITHLLHGCRETLSRLAGEYCDAKNVIGSKLSKAAACESTATSLTLVEALAEVESRQLLSSDGDVGTETAEEGKLHTLKAALQTIVDTVPASLQIHFGLQADDAAALTRCSRLTDLLKFLLAEYLSMEHYMEEVEKQRLSLVRVFRLMQTEFADDVADEKAQIEDALARSLELLRRTVTAVVTFPHQISEEEIALRRVSAEAVDELAQLLVESRYSGAATAATSGSLCPGSSTAVARIEPPTRNLLEMVEMVKSRFATLLSQQQRKELAGMQSRVGLAHMEESMKNQGKQIMQQLRDLCTMQDDGGASDQPEGLTELMGTLDLEKNLTPGKLDYFLSDVVERLRVVRTRMQRAVNAAASNKTRAEAAAQKCATTLKKLHKVAVYVDRIGKDGLGIAFPAQLSSSSGGGTNGAADSEDGRGDGISALRRLNLRPDTETAPHKVAPAASAGPTDPVVVTESNVLEALQFLTTRLCANDALRDQLKVNEELDQLRKSQASWKADTAAFHEAMSMLMRRLASNGQLVKHSLFMMGTDESAKDDLVEEVLQRGEDKPQDEAEVEYVERSLAELLQKYTRWAQRLQQTTEDHLYTQRKIVKYFAAVRRFFTSQQSKSSAPVEDIPDDNLYDIDSCLMRAADVILPALDAAIQGVEGQRGAAAAAEGRGAGTPPLSPPATATATAGDAAPRQEAIAQLVKDSAASAAGGVLPYDHRIARLYETVARLYTAVTSLLQVHYLCIPSAVRRRSSGDVDLVFDGDADEDGFVDIDLDRLIRVSQRRGGDEAAAADGQRFAREGATGEASRHSPPPPPPSTVAANNDVILRVTYQNMEVLQDTLKRFSNNHKMAAIVLQKDMDALQQQLASMLEKYSEVDMETAFGQSRDELHELYLTLRDRAQLQKGCYFFNRIGGEGSCTWVTALEQLGEGFRGVVDRLVQRTAQAADYRELTDEVVDLCAMYVNWAEQHALPPAHALPAELMALCVRDDNAAAAAAAVDAGSASESAQRSPTTTTAAGSSAKAAQRPPKPSSTPSLTPRDSIKKQQELQEKASEAAAVPAGPAAPTAAPKVSCFTEDRAVLKVMEHMFQLAQQAAEPTAAAASSATAAATSRDAEARAQQLSEELAVLREAVAVAERHVDELTASRQAVERQRDQAQSEAAVARAELRRWKRQQQQQQQEENDVDRPPRVIAAASPGRTPPPSSTSEVSAAAPSPAAMDEATVREVMAYMKTLSEELQAAKQRAGVAAPRDTRQAEGAVRSPYTAALDDNGGIGSSATDDGDDDGAAMWAAPAPPNRYSALADELRHRYGTSALSPMVVVDPQTHYTHPRSHASSSRGTAQRRYSPVKFRGPAYDACDRYYTRELAEREAEHRGDGALPAFTSLTAPRTPQRHSSRRRAAADSAEVHYDAHFGGSAARRSMRNVASSTPQRYPRSLARDAPLPVPLTAAAATPQRSTPVTTAAALTTRVAPPPHRSAAAMPHDVDHHHHPHFSEDRRYDEEREEEEGEEEEEVFYDDANWRRDERWKVPSQVKRRTPSTSGRHRVASPGASLTTTTTTTAATSRSVSARAGPSAAVPADLSTNLAEAVRQIEAATTTPRRRPTPTRRDTQQRGQRAGSAAPAAAAAAAAVAATPEEQMSRNANLRSTALRRLAEVVSRTKVSPSRSARF